MNDSRLKTENDEIRGIVAEEVRKQMQPEFMTKADVCQRLHISLQTVNNHIAAQRLRAYKVGSRVLLRTSDVDEFIITKPIIK